MRDDTMHADFMDTVPVTYRHDSVRHARSLEAHARPAEIVFSVLFVAVCAWLAVYA